MVAMVGRNCVAIACDKRLGQEFLTLSTEFPKIMSVHDRLYLGLSGLATDVQTLQELFKFRSELYKLKEGRDIAPSAFAHMVSSSLYSKRYVFFTFCFTN